MAYTASQRKIIRRIRVIGREVGASPKEVKAAFETGRVESNFSNSPVQSDHDSEGWRQERASLYKDPTNLDASIRRFFAETRAVKANYGTAGALAAAVQRPAAQYRGRYQGVSSEAQALLDGTSGGGGSSSSAPRPAPTKTGGSVATTSTKTTTTPGVDNSALRAQAITTFLGRQNQDPLQFALGIRSLQDVPGKSTTTTSRTAPAAKPASGQLTPRSSTVPSGSITAAKGTALFEGKRVAAWIAPALAYARERGWKGTVSSGYRSFADQTRIYNSGVRPAAKPGTSNHEGSDFPRGAVDVTDAPQLSDILSHSPYGGLLKWAGSKDPVHFSHPHNGSY